MTTARIQRLQGGLSSGGLQKYLQQERNRLIQTPILLLPSSSTKTHYESVEQACKQVQFILSQQLGLRTIVSQPRPLQLEYAFPTQATVEQSMQVAKRVGATSSVVVGVGSGFAMDLAKAVAAELNATELLLVPATYGATLVSTMSHALLLDTEEEEILVPTTTRTTTPKITVAVPSSRLMMMTNQNERTNALLAAISLVSKLDDSLLLQTILDLLENNKEEEEVMNALMDAGQLAADSLLPLTLLASLLPKHFPQHDALEFLASLAPILLKETMMASSSSSPPRVVTTESVDTLLQSVLLLLQHRRRRQEEVDIALLRRILSELTLAPPPPSRGE